MAKSFLDPETPLEVQMSTKQQLAGGALFKHQRDMVAHALTTGLKDLERASNLVGAFDDMEDRPTQDRVREAHREMTEAATHPLGHALRLLGSRLNDMGHRRRSNLADSSKHRWDLIGSSNHLFSQPLMPVLPYVSRICQL